MTIALREGPDVDVDAIAELRASCDFSPLSHDTIAAQLAGSRWIAHAYDGARLVGFARAISDGVTTGYVSSVMVDAAYRRRGIGRMLIAKLTGGRDGIKFVLHTRRDSAAFYATLGFADAPDMMVRDRR
ncbi:MAG TPA: GNAT family N-acetyltransferase [Kofleriaceae bacterium]